MLLPLIWGKYTNGICKDTSNSFWIEKIRKGKYRLFYSPEGVTTPEDWGIHKTIRRAQQDAACHAMRLGINDLWRLVACMLCDSENLVEEGELMPEGYTWTGQRILCSECSKKVVKA